MSTASLAKTAYDEVVEELIEQINMGRSYEELLTCSDLPAAATTQCGF